MPSAELRLFMGWQGSFLYVFHIWQFSLVSFAAIEPCYELMHAQNVVVKYMKSGKESLSEYIALVPQLYMHAHATLSYSTSVETLDTCAVSHLELFLTLLWRFQAFVNATFFSSRSLLKSINRARLYYNTTATIRCKVLPNHVFVHLCGASMRHRFSHKSKRCTAPTSRRNILLHSFDGK